MKDKMFVTYRSVADFLSCAGGTVAALKFKSKYRHIHPNIDGFIRKDDGVLNNGGHLSAGFPPKLPLSCQVSVQELLDVLQGNSSLNNRIENKTMSDGINSGTTATGNNIKSTQTINNEPKSNRPSDDDLVRLIKHLKEKYGEEIVVRLAESDGLYLRNGTIKSSFDDLLASI